MTFIWSCITQAYACAGQRQYYRVEDSKNYKKVGFYSKTKQNQEMPADK